jgi:hypothetical protein
MSSVLQLRSLMRTDRFDSLVREVEIFAPYLPDDLYLRTLLVHGACAQRVSSAESSRKWGSATIPETSSALRY